MSDKLEKTIKQLRENNIELETTKIYLRISSIKRPVKILSVDSTVNL